MAESRVAGTISEYVDGVGSSPGGTGTEDYPEKENADSPESSLNLVEHIYTNVDPKTDGGSAGEGAKGINSQPKGVDVDTVGHMCEVEHDNQENGDSRDPNLADANCHDKSGNPILNVNKGEVDYPMNQTTLEVGNDSGSTIAEEKSRPIIEGGSNKSQESNTSVIQDSPEEPMEEDASDTGGQDSEPQVPTKSDSKDQSEDDSEMDVDDATGQISAVSGPKDVAKGESKGTSQADSLTETVSEPEHTITGNDDGNGQANTITSAVRSDQKCTTEGVDKSPAVAMDETKCTTEGENNGTGTETGNIQEHTTEEMGDRPADTDDELKRLAEGENNGIGSSAEIGNKQKNITKEMDDGNRQGCSQPEARTKRKNSHQEKDEDEDDDDDDDDDWGGYSRSWASRDTQRYRSGYQDIGKQNDQHRDKNYKFYTNQIPSQPNGDLIEDIHANWKGNYTHLEVHHGYIQWLFPIRERGLNWDAQELQSHEIESICADEVAHKRILASYELMLDFYGMKLIDPKTGELGRADNWEGRFRHLNHSMHNYLRITRILKCLGEFNYEHLKAPFVQFVLHEAIVERTLSNTLDSCLNYWLQVIKDDKERKEVKKYAQKLLGGEQNKKKKKNYGYRF